MRNVVPGTDLYDGCSFLDSGGDTVIRLLPSAVVVLSALLAARLRRPGLTHVGFLLAILVLLLALALEPSEYPV